MLYTSFTASGKYSHVRAASVVALLACWTAAGAEPVVGFEIGLGRVRSSNVAILTMLSEGSERSPALQALVDRISGSDGLVYVEYGYCAFGHLNACVLPYLVAAQGQRYLRVLISPDRTRVSHDQRLALIAHELQHAIEILDDRDVVDVLSMQTMFRRIGIPLLGREGYETTAARAAGDKVYDELTRSSRRRGRSGGRRVIERGVRLRSAAIAIASGVGATGKKTGPCIVTARLPGWFTMPLEERGRFDEGQRSQ